MVDIRSLTASAGAVLMLALLAPMALSQTVGQAPPDAVATLDDSMVVIPQEELDAIHGQLAALTLRVDDIEAVVGAAPDAGTPEEGEPIEDAPVVEPAPVATSAPVVLTKPRKPVATSDTQRHFTVHDPNHGRGLVTWTDRADDEDGYRLYAKRVYCELVPGTNPDQLHDYDDFQEARSEFVRVGKVAADATAFRPVHDQVRAKLPDIPGQQYGSGEIYQLFVAAYNEAGESRRVKVAEFITTPEFMCP